MDIYDWAANIRESLATDKSNDWSEEIAELDAILDAEQEDM